MASKGLRDPEAADLDLAPAARWTLLAVVGHYDAAGQTPSVGEVKQRVAEYDYAPLSPGTVGRGLRRLVEAGAVERECDPGDARERGYRPTDAGLDYLQAMVGELAAEAEPLLDEAEVDA